MSRRYAAALMLAIAASGAPSSAAGAPAQAVDSFEVVPRKASVRPTHRTAWAFALAGAGLVAASFPLADLADRRYASYLEASDPGVLEDRYDASVRADRLSSASLIAGETLIAGAVWLRFVHRPHPPRASLLVLPDRCAVRLRF